MKNRWIISLDDIWNVLKLATYVREIIETNKDFWSTKYDDGFSKFPIWCCAKASELLLKYLKENWINNFDYIEKTGIYNEKEYPHVWLENDNYTLDITWDQFNGKWQDISFKKIIFIPKNEYFFNKMDGRYEQYKQTFLEPSESYLCDYQNFYSHLLSKTN